jgi:hydroxymethylbilane synthase
VLHQRSDLTCEPVRGNVPTRLGKFREGDAEGIILAHAGLLRLGLGAYVTQRLDPALFVPACGQGAMVIEIRADDAPLRALCAPLDHIATRLCVTAERAFLRALGGGCTAPAGAYARFDGGADALVLTGMAATSDGRRLVRSTLSRALSEAKAASDVGQQLAEQLLVRGVAAFLSETAVGARVIIQ